MGRWARDLDGVYGRVSLRELAVWHHLLLPALPGSTLGGPAGRVWSGAGSWFEGLRRLRLAHPMSPQAKW